MSEHTRDYINCEPVASMAALRDVLTVVQDISDFSQRPKLTRYLEIYRRENDGAVVCVFHFSATETMTYTAVDPLTFDGWVVI